MFVLRFKLGLEGVKVDLVQINERLCIVGYAWLANNVVLRRNGNVQQLLYAAHDFGDIATWGQRKYFAGDDNEQGDDATKRGSGKIGQDGFVKFRDRICQ